ncbi:glycoside hydrolase family 13 protein [Croceiramulus getboli]|nr:glycoside hydrolase family 13 protein [Flavobacteriaceae bacterium YJPT1-3]
MKLLRVLLCLFTLVAQAQITRVEPPFWWTGMEHAQVEVLLNGPSISDYEVSSSDLEILKIDRVENPNYLFVTLQTAEQSAGTYHLKLTISGKKAQEIPFELRQRRPDSKNRQGFKSSDLIYLIMADRFANGDPANDSVSGLKEKADRSKQGGRHGGDIQGIIDHLDYLQELGATAIWNTPLLEDDDAQYSYHTYAQSDVYRIDPRYGSNADYVRLAREMHQRDMKLIMDYVTNHWGAEHWMIKDLPEYDWIHQFPGYANTNYRMTTQYDPNTSQIDKRYNEDGWFVRSMPDLNQRNPRVLNYLIQNAIWWIEYADLDGLRVDTYSYNNKEEIAQWTQAIMNEYPNFNVVGEVWLHNSAQIAYWQKDSKIGAIQNFNSHLPSVMDFTLHDAIGLMFQEEASWDTGMIRAYENLVNDFLYTDIDKLLVFAENHDTQRINTVLDGSLDDYKLTMALIGTVRGIPQIYYGSEIGMQGDKAKGDGDIRRDFPGGWEGDPVNAFTPEGRTLRQSAYHDFTKTLFQWRKTASAVHQGKTTQYIPENNVYVYFREDDQQRIMVVLNNNKEPQTLKLDRFRESINTSTSGKEILSGKTFQLDGKLNVAAKTPLIIELAMNK